jgi:hypothetical protein
MCTQCFYSEGGKNSRLFPNLFNVAIVHTPPSVPPSAIATQYSPV